jgi:DnaJ-class molecular chaperone
MSKEFDPKNIIDFNKDYYSILGISKENLPDNKTRQNKIEISQLIEKSFRKQARKAHPDFGGSKELFLDLVRARRILEDPLLRRIYDQGHFDEFEMTTISSDFSIDWNKVGTFRKGTPEDTIGYQ